MNTTIERARKAYRELHARWRLAQSLYRKGHIPLTEYLHVRRAYRLAVVTMDRAQNHQPRGNTA